MPQAASRSFPRHRLHCSRHQTSTTSSSSNLRPRHQRRAFCGMMSGLRAAAGKAFRLARHDVARLGPFTPPTTTNTTTSAAATTGARMHSPATYLNTSSSSALRDQRPYLTYGATLRGGLSVEEQDQVIARMNARIRGGAPKDQVHAFGVTSCYDFSKTIVFMRVPSNCSTLAAELASIPNVECVDTRADRELSYSYTTIPDTGNSFRPAWHMDPEKRDPLGLPTHADGDVLMIILDSPVDSTHVEFHDGQVARLSTDGSHIQYNPPVIKTQDTSHGTFVASLVGGRHCGIVPTQKIISVGLKSLAVEDVAQSIHAVKTFLRLEQNVDKRAIINLSIGGTASPQLVEALRGIGDLQLGGDRSGRQVLMVGAAGNNCPNLPAHTQFPGNLNSVLLVGAVDQHLCEAEWSNFGHRIDLFAPGEKVWGARSQHMSSQSPYRTWDGTSFAAPIVCGLALRELAYLDAESARNKRLSVDMATLKDHILETARRQATLRGQLGSVQLAACTNGEGHSGVAPFAPYLLAQLPEMEGEIGGKA